MGVGPQLRTWENAIFIDHLTLYWIVGLHAHTQHRVRIAGKFRGVKIFNSKNGGFRE